MWILDRIEGDRAVIETDQGRLELPRQQLPPDAKEGDVLCSTAQGILVDTATTARRRQEIAEKYRRLRSRK
ncbi:DUF3006 domain-containing protein [Ruminococcus sp.]|uniref:DUF3006 domain-containing protein n=1 Tax=Ruminococcus sp. TaxID=41978 RepID=UPI003F0FA3EC